MKQAVQFTPWRSIRDGLVAPVEGSKSYAASLESPCQSCSTSPCCTHLPLHNFRVNVLGDLNYAGYLLNFAYLRLGLTRCGEWSVYYAHPCRFLDRDTFNCSLHNTPQQPRICVNYNPYGCWYRKVFASPDNSELVLIDRARFRRLTELLAFDEHQRITDAPDFDSIVEVLSGILEESESDTAGSVSLAHGTGYARETEGDQTSGGEAIGSQFEPGVAVMSADVAPTISPCDGCSAPCCETLVFPQGVPSLASGFDWYRFCLGYPGIELSIGPDQWSLVVKTSCQHLVDGRCSVYGKPERPLFCRYYDEWKCTYRSEFGSTPSPASFPVRLAEFDALLECFDLDSTGAVVAASTFEAMREHVASSSPHVSSSNGAARPSPQDAKQSTTTSTVVAITAKPKVVAANG